MSHPSGAESAPVNAPAPAPKVSAHGADQSPNVAAPAVDSDATRVRERKIGSAVVTIPFEMSLNEMNELEGGIGSARVDRAALITAVNIAAPTLGSEADLENFRPASVVIESMTNSAPFPVMVSFPINKTTALVASPGSDNTHRTIFSGNKDIGMQFLKDHPGITSENIRDGLGLIPRVGNTVPFTHPVAEFIRANPDMFNFEKLMQRTDINIPDAFVFATAAVDRAVDNICAILDKNVPSINLGNGLEMKVQRVNGVAASSPSHLCLPMAASATQGKQMIEAALSHRFTVMATARIEFYY